MRPQTLQRSMENKAERLIALGKRFAKAAENQGRTWRSKLDGLDRLHETLGYQATLERGYAVVRDSAGTLVSDVAAARLAQELEIQFKDGRIATGGTGASAPVKPKAAAPKKAKSQKDDDQGSLF